MTEPATPSAIGRYALERELGRGGMGVVYAARAPDGQAVAFKLLLPGACGPEDAARFLREARAMGSIQHPNLVACLDAGEHVGSPFLVMEYIEGVTLGARLRQSGTLAADDVVRIAAQVAAALAALHDAGLVHRDVKSDNVLLTATGHAKLGDLGLVTGLDFSRLTRTQEVVGTPHCMAPEQVEGTPTSPATDVYGMGVLLYEVLSAAPPFRGPLLQVLRAHSTRTPPPLGPEVPPALAQLVSECLAKSPAERPRDGGALRARLTELNLTAAGPPPRGVAFVVVAAISALLGTTALALTWSAQSTRSSPDPNAPAEPQEQATAASEESPAWRAAERMEFTRAEALAREAWAENPRDAVAALTLGRILGLRLKHEEALEVAAQGRALEPRNELLLALEQGMLCRLTRLEAAAELTRQLEEANPGSLSTTLARISAAGPISANEERWRVLTELTARYPDSLRARLARVSHEAAVKPDAPFYRATLEAFPQAARMIRFFRVQALQFTRANERALKLLRESFPERADNADVLCIEAELLANTDQRREARSTAERAYAVDGSLWRARLLSAQLAREDGDLPRARELAREGLERVADSVRWRFCFELARIALRSRRFEEALEWSSNMGDAPEVLASRTRLRASAYRYLDRLEDALRELHAWSQAQPRNPDPWLELAKFTSAQGRHVDSERHAAQALELDPDSAVGWEVLAGSRYSQGVRGPRVDQPLKEALRLGNDSAKLRFLLTVSALDTKRFAEGRAHLDRALSLPCPPRLRQDLEQLDSNLRAAGF